MATISVLSYGNPSTMQTQQSNNGLKFTALNRVVKCASDVRNNNNSDKTTNLNSSSMIGSPTPKQANKRTYSQMSKKAKALPLSETNSNVVVTPTTSSPLGRPAKQPKTMKRTAQVDIDPNVLCRASSGKSKMFPLPVAVARRNARERNRVKQVNNGFAALRERIPEEVAEAYEAQGNGRSSVKKLSKVETLRMAVEYIRGLEKMLGMEMSLNDSTIGSDCHLSNESYHLSDTSSVLSTLTPPPSDNISSGSFDDSDCTLPDVTIIDGHQYIRIPGTNTYQLFENDENIEPLSIIQDDQTNAIMAQSNVIVDNATHCYGNGVATAAFHTPIHIMTPASISPDTYNGRGGNGDGHSSTAAGLSPADMQHEIITTTTAVSATKMMVNDQLPFVAMIKNEIDGDCDNDSALYMTSYTTGNDAILLKTKIKDDIDLNDPELSEENMIEAMHWLQNQHSVNAMQHS